MMLGGAHALVSALVDIHALTSAPRASRHNGTTAIVVVAAENVATPAKRSMP